MNIWRLATRGLWFHRRMHAAVILGVTVAAAILCGALAVGDSVRFSLRQMALARLGKIELALAPHDRLFRAQLADEVGKELGATAAPMLLLQGTATAGGGQRRANRVQVSGVEARFWQLGDEQADATKGVVLNERLARQLSVKVGDDIVLRVEKPSLLGRDAPLSKDEDALTALRLPVTRILPDSTIGRFSLQANQVPPYNAFVDLRALQSAVEQPGRANQILIGGRSFTDARSAALALDNHFALSDTGAYWRAIPSQSALELRSARVFLDPILAIAAMRQPGAKPFVTYFANAIQIGGRSIPYSMVAGVTGLPLPASLGADQIVLNEWAARDLKAKNGDSVALRYFVMGPGRQLEEKQAKFRLAAIVPIAGAARDPDLLPDFPGIAGAKNCRDWEPGMAVDLRKIRPQDEKYWDDYRGTPKAFVALAGAKELFQNRFGDLTAVRFPLSANRAALEKRIMASAGPSTLGLSFVPVRMQAEAASTQSLDFGGLFLGLSFFLIVAALLLLALLFALGVETRGREIGTLLAIGYAPKTVRRLLLAEGALLAAIGAVPGSLLGLLYAKVVLRGLNSIWQGAVGTAQLQFHVEATSLAGGAIGGAIMALGAIYLVIRKQAKTPARVLLSGAPAVQESEFANGGNVKAPRGNRRAVTLSVGVFVAAIGTLAYSATLPSNKQAEMFFCAAAMLLAALLIGCNAALLRVPHGSALDIVALAGRGLRRRRGRSLSVIALLAGASFIIASIGVFRHDPLSDDTLRRRDSGTGGFSLWAESAVPIYQDLNSQKGREQFSLDELKASFVPLRVREGDDASCLNLNRAQTPTLWGVNPAQLETRGAFGTVKGKGWDALNVKSAAIPAIGDENTVLWGLGKGIGDTLNYVDGAGIPFQVRIVGLVNKTILQGGLLISEENFVRIYPSASGYRAFLIDVPKAQDAVSVSGELSQEMQDYGLEVVPAAQRLALFQAVENTYLAVFQALGGLGLLLGSIGLGVVVLRNVLERRGELAVLSAVGFRAGTLRRLIFLEHAFLAALGLGVGALAGAMASLPSLRGESAPYGTLLLTFGGVGISALLWTGLAAALAMRGATLETLRSE